MSSQHFNDWVLEADIGGLVKIDPNDTLYSVILNLLTNLNHDMLSSNITSIVSNYLEMVKDIDEPYDDVINEIENVFKNNSWIDREFYFEPNQYKLIEELQSVVNKYLF